jgi:hypothetical protein
VIASFLHNTQSGLSSEKYIFMPCKIVVDLLFLSASTGHLYDRNIFMGHHSFMENPPLVAMPDTTGKLDTGNPREPSFYF